jgi:3-oxoadipate enol-lactonase
MPTVKIRDIDVYHEVHGTGEPVLLLHGLGSSTEDWAPQVDHLAGRWRVITCDVRGHGRTSKPRARYTIHQFAADVAALLEFLDCGPAHVVGLSMGGCIAFQLALDRPDLVRSLVIVNSGPELILRTWRERLAIRMRDVIVRVSGMQKMGEVLAPRLLPGEAHAELRRRFVERWARNDGRAYLRALHAMVGWSVTARLGEIRCPVLVVASEFDYTPTSAKAAYLQRIHGARLVEIPNAHHAVPIEDPAALNQVLDPFLREVADAQR